MLRSAPMGAIGFVALLSASLPAQVQLDWQQTYATASLPAAGTLDQVIVLEIASNGDLVWSSQHGFLDPVTQNWLQRTELHRTSTSGAALWTISPAPNSDVMYYGAEIDAVGDIYFWGRAGVLYSYPDVLVTKVSASGTHLWTRQINGVTNDYDVGFGSLDASGNFSVVGMLDLFSTLFVRTYDPSGNVLAHGTQGSFASGLAAMRRARRLPAGDFVALGEGFNGATVARISTAGTATWSRELSPSSPGSSVNLFSLDVDGSGRIVAAGADFDSSVGSRTLMRVFDSAGNVLLDYSGPLCDGASSQSGLFAPDGSIWLLSNERATPGASTQLIVRRFSASLAAGPTLSLPYTGPYALTFSPIVGESNQLWAIVGGDTLIELSPAATLNWSVPLLPPNSPDSFNKLALDSTRHFVATGFRDTSTPASYETDALLARFDAGEMPLGYCVGMPGALGCSPRLTFEGSPRAGAPSGFTVRAAPWTSQLAGHFLVGTGSAIANPFFGGTLCVGVPRVRTTALFSGGNPIGADCTGSLALDYGAFASGALGGTLLPGLQLAGTQVRLQAWSRDPGSATNTLLSNALEFTVLP